MSGESILTTNLKTTRSETIALDAKRITTELLPDISLRTWRRLDCSHKCPAGYFVGARKLYLRSHIELWARWGFPNRVNFEQRLRLEEQVEKNAR